MHASIKTFEQHSLKLHLIKFSEILLFFCFLNHNTNLPISYFHGPWTKSMKQYIQENLNDIGMILWTNTKLG